MLDANLRPYYVAPLAELVSVGGAQVFGHFEREPIDAIGVAGTSPQLRVLAADVPQIATGAAVICAQQSYTVRNIRSLNAGAELLLMLEAV